MKNALRTLLACAALLPTAALADNWYAGASGDLTWPDHADTGGGGNVNLGYRFSQNNMGAWRVEGEVGYHEADGDSGYGDLNYLTYMGNVYFDSNINLTPGSSMTVTPYIGGGIGDAQVNYGDSTIANTFHHHHNKFAYQGMAGLNLVDASMPNTSWFLGYRYLGTDEDNLNASNAELGLRYNF